MIQTRHNNLNTGTINLSETKEKFLENILREISPHLTDKQYNTLRIVLVNELGKVEILDPLRGYDERLEDECDKLLELFIRTKRLEGKSEKTLNFYKTSIEKLFKFLNNKPVSLITADDIRGFLSDRINKGISMVTANNFRRNLSSFFSWCFNEDYILKSPMVKIKPFKELNDVKKELKSFLPEKIINTYLNQGVLKRIRFLSNTLPVDELDILDGYEPEEGYVELKIQINKDNRKPIIEKIKKLIKNKSEESKEYNNIIGNNLETEDIKLEIDLNGSERTFTINKLENAVPARDITDELEDGDDGHRTFESIHKKGKEYADDIYRS